VNPKLTIEFVAKSLVDAASPYPPHEILQPAQRRGDPHPPNESLMINATTVGIDQTAIRQLPVAVEIWR